jgi:hypothetical protein
MRRGKHFDPVWLAGIKQEYLAAKSSGKSEAAAVIDKYAEIAGVDRSTIFRKLHLNSCSRDRSEAVKLRRSEIDAYALDVWHFQKSKETADTPFSTISAYKCLRHLGRIPASLTFDQVYQSLRRQHVRRRAVKPPTLFEHGSPLSMLQIDYSVSRYFKVHEEGTVIMSGKKGYYKGQQENERLRLWICIAVDDHSRVAFAEYRITSGESAAMVQSFLLAALAEKSRVIEETGEIVPLPLYQGVPKHLYWDRGPGNTAPSTIAGIEALGIKLMGTGNLCDEYGTPTVHSNKRAHGKVENAVRDVKCDFEQFLWGILKKNTIITLTALNEELLRWLADRNNKLHPRHDSPRWEMFRESLADARFPGDDEMSKFANVYERVVRDGLINVGRNKYALAPDDVSNNTRVLITKEHNSYYILRNGRRELLRMNDGKAEIRTELPTDMLTGKILRDRLNDELSQMSGGHIELGDVRDQPVLDHFFDTPRSIAEIKSIAHTIVSNANQPTNIIMMQ